MYYLYFSPPQGESLDQHPALAHRVLPPLGGDHPPDLPRGSPPRQVCPLHHDPRHIQVRDKSPNRDGKYVEELTDE